MLFLTLFSFPFPFVDSLFSTNVVKQVYVQPSYHVVKLRAKWTDLEKSAAKENPLKFDSSLALFGNMLRRKISLYK